MNRSLFIDEMMRMRRQAERDEEQEGKKNLVIKKMK